MFLGTRSCKTWSSTLFPIMLIMFEDRHMGPHTRMASFSVRTGTYTYTHARTRTRTHAHIHTLSNHECTCMPDRKLKNHNISFRDSRMHSSGRPVCIHTTHKNPELQRMCRSCLIESTCTHTHILAGSETCTHTHTNTHTGSYFAILHCTGRPV